MADPQNQMPLPPPPAPVLPPAGPQNQQQGVPPVINPLNQQANNVPIVQAQVVQGADGGMALKVQQTKLPEFWGQKDKDSISANEFVKRVDKMMSTNNWSNKVAFDNFSLGPQMISKHVVGLTNHVEKDRWRQRTMDDHLNFLQGGFCNRI